MSFDSLSPSAYSVINDVIVAIHRAFRGAAGPDPDRREVRADAQPARRWEIDNLSPISTKIFAYDAKLEARASKDDDARRAPTSHG